MLNAHQPQYLCEKTLARSVGVCGIHTIALPFLWQALVIASLVVYDDQRAHL